MKFFTVTLTLAATAYDLLVLLKAAYPTFRDGARSIVIQSPASAAGYIRVGGPDVSATVYGIDLPLADASAALPSYSIAGTWALAQNAGEELDITMVY